MRDSHTLQGQLQHPSLPAEAIGADEGYGTGEEEERKGKGIREESVREERGAE